MFPTWRRGQAKTQHHSRTQHQGHQYSAGPPAGESESLHDHLTTLLRKVKRSGLGCPVSFAETGWNCEVAGQPPCKKQKHTHTKPKINKTAFQAVPLSSNFNNILILFKKKRKSNRKMISKTHLACNTQRQNKHTPKQNTYTTLPPHHCQQNGIKVSRNTECSLSPHPTPPTKTPNHRRYTSYSEMKQSSCGLNMLSRHNVETHQGNKLTCNSSGNAVHRCLSLLSHCGLIPGIIEWNCCAWADLHLKTL